MGSATVVALQDKESASKPARADDPVRTCIATRHAASKDGLIRFVVSPDGVVTPDLDGKLPGRGQYVLPNRAALAKAAKKNLFARAAKRAVTTPADLPEKVEGLLVKRCVEQIGLARRAGAAIAGFEKVKARLKQEGAVLVLSALDGADDGKAKLAALAKATNAKTLSPLNRAELAQAFGRDDSVHAAIEIDGGFNSLLRCAVWLDAMRNQADNPLAVGGGGTGRNVKSPKSKTI